MTSPVTARGVYKDLSISPHEVISSCGDCLKFPSAKKKNMYLKELPKRIDMLRKLCAKINVMTGSSECDAEHLIHLIEIQLYRNIVKDVEKLC